MGIVITFPVGKARKDVPALSPRGSASDAVLSLAFTPWRTVALGIEMWMEWLELWTCRDQPPRQAPENVVSIASARGQAQHSTQHGKIQH